MEGPIGVGKTSLVDLLAKRFRGTKVLEDADNPFLGDFYKDKRGAAFRCQLFFLLSRYDQQRSISQRELFTELILADYTFAKDKIFAYLTLEDSE
ncbi:MAG: deoxynucleoside kinase, partial [Acidobacteriota bacterium]